MTKHHTAFTIELDAGERVSVGDISITLVKKSGRKARIEISAPKTVAIQPRDLGQCGKTCAQECAPNPPGAPHGQHPLRLRTPALP